MLERYSGHEAERRETNGDIIVVRKSEGET
jgi:hypothetical protein